MRRLVIVLALLGALLSGGIGLLRMVSHEKNKAAAEADRRQFEDPGTRLTLMLAVALKPETRDEVRRTLDKYNEQRYDLVYRRARTFPFLFGAAALAMMAGILAGRRHGYSAAALLAGTFVAPGILYPPALFVTSPLLLPAFLALFIRPAQPGAAAHGGGGRDAQVRPRRASRL